MPETYITTENYYHFVDALIAAASTLTDMPELIERNAIILALGEVGDIWPDTIRENAA